MMSKPVTFYVVSEGIGDAMLSENSQMILNGLTVVLRGRRVASKLLDSAWSQQTITTTNRAYIPQAARLLHKARTLLSDCDYSYTFDNYTAWKVSAGANGLEARVIWYKPGGNWKGRWLLTIQDLVNLSFWLQDSGFGQIKRAQKRLRDLNGCREEGW